ncbi:Leukocyte receptor cluster member 8 [Chionoecetes opilio]|uniref:Leukocyte receptor cluster member 8 n=1 Tax=Chionoecetes opilio TaxID=41210 RepID=A0A8J4YKF6_CHIOP|nr:Leukocyte receptor cluster member 8 [Chionoecetes opilio]
MVIHVPPLRGYVGRCFSRCQTELDKDQVEICLKGKLTQAANNGALWTKNWDEESLPSIHSESTLNLLSHIKNWNSNTGSSNTPLNSGSTNDSAPESTPSPVKTPQSKKTYKKQQHPMSHGYSVHSLRSSRSKSHSRSRTRSRSSSSRSRSRSRSPVYRRTRRDSKRRHSSGSEEEAKGGYIRLSTKRGRSPYGRGGRGNKKIKGKNNSSERLQKRAARFSGVLDVGPPRKKKLSLNITKTISNTKILNNMFTVDGDDMDWTTIHVVGTNTTMEKNYLRLTAAPDPATVRTVDTLRKSLEHIKRQWVKNQDYRYACDQLKSLRQDLTIQGIRNDFTVQVYETHSRIALEKGDHEEFNQCQSQLKQLYSEVGGDNSLEFVAYRLLYYIFTKNTLDITSLMAGLSSENKENECISFSLKLRAAWSLGNYHRFFKLYRVAPKMAGYLVDWFADRERRQALRAMLKGYRPGSLEVSFIRSELALGTQEEWQKFESTVSLAYTDTTKAKIDCKVSTAEAPPS